MNGPAAGMTGMPGMPIHAPRMSGLALAGFILSLVGYNQVKNSRGQLTGRGFAIAGMAISGVIFVVGVLAAVAVPAFVGYMHKAKKSEVQLELNKLGRNAKVIYITNAEFPVFDQPLTPAASCCSTGGKCPGSVTDWQTPAWQALDFEVSEPHLYRYGFKSTKDSLEATAVGDLDCDGEEATYRLHVTTTNGNATVLLEEPPPGAM